MKLDIVPLHDDARYCGEDMIAAVAKWLGTDYELIFAESWGFVFREHRPGTLLGDSLEDVSNDISKIKLADKYHGLQVRVHQTNDIGEFLKTLAYELENNRPVGINIDVYWCPWFKAAYQNYHATHYCLVVGINDDGSLQCIDSSPFTYGEKLSMDVFEKGFYNEFITFGLTANVTPYVDWKKIFLDTVKMLNGGNGRISSFAAMKKFSDEVASSMSLDEEIKGYGDMLYDAKLFAKIQKVSRGRRQFARVIEYIAKNYDAKNLLEFCKPLERIGLQWGAIRGTLIKACYAKERTEFIKNAANKIREVADKEEELANQLVQIIESDSLTPIKTYHNKDNANKIQKITFIDLENYLNNQGFGCLDLDSLAEFSAGGGYFLKEGLPPSEIWEAGAMQFCFPKLFEGKRDNLVCSKQYIYIPQGIYSSIMLLGCAEWGNYSETMLVEYVDGTVDHIPLEFTDWSLAEPVFSETIAWTGRAAVRSKSKVDTMQFLVRIFAKAYELDKSRLIKGLHLPDCRNLHIFAISLG